VILFLNGFNDDTVSGDEYTSFRESTHHVTGGDGIEDRDGGFE
jgi:hypothetical protein